MIPNNFGHRIFDMIFWRGHLPADCPWLKSYNHYSLTPECHLFVSPNDELKIFKTENGDRYFLIGAVFTLNPTTPENSDGHFICIRQEQNSNSFTFSRNLNSHIGIYYFNANSTQIVFSDFYKNHAPIKNLFPLSTNPEALGDFLSHGFITFGKTLTKEIHQLEFKHRLQLSSDLLSIHKEPQLKMNSLNLNSPAEFYEFIKMRFSLWLKNCKFNSIAISGGLDSRTILSTLYSHPLDHNISLHTRVHPDLTPEQDRDALLARQAASLLPYPHYFQSSTASPSEYLSQTPPAVPPLMSGLYGGEYIGGEFLFLISLKDFDSQKKNRDTEFASRIYRHSSPSKSLDNNVPLKLEILSQAFLCDIYGGAWGSMASHHNLTFTPFWDSQVIEALSQIPADDFRDYKLYQKLFALFPQPLKDVPLNSLMSVYYPETPATQQGTDAKTIPAPQKNFHVDSDLISDLLPTHLKDKELSPAQLVSLQKYITLVKL